MLAGAEPPHLERIMHGGALPESGRMKVNLKVADAGQDPAGLAMAELIRSTYPLRANRPQIHAVQEQISL